jgi:uncharacterized membrane protein
MSKDTSIVSPPPTSGPGLRGMFQRAAQGLRRRIVASPELSCIVLVVVVLSVFLWWVQLLAYLSYNTFAQDLGAYNQALYNTAYNHVFLYYTTQTQGRDTGAVLSVHFSPILSLLVPAYWVSPGPPTLLLLKQFAIESAAIPLYLLARLKLKSRTFPAILAIGYLVAAPAMAIAWTTFDPETLLPLTILTALYFQARRHWVGFLTAWVAALAVIETAAPLLAVYAALGLVGEYWWEPSEADPKIEARDRKFLLVGLVAAIAGFAVSWADLNLVYDTGGGFGAGYARHFAVLGASSIPDVPIRVITHPGAAVDAITSDGTLKLLYFVVIFGSVGFLALFARLRFLGPPALWLGLVALSSVPGWFELGSQYAGYIVPWAFAGALDGAPRLARLLIWLWNPDPSLGSNSESVRRARRASVLAVTVTFAVGVIVVAAVASPLLPSPVDSSGNISFGINQISPHDAQINQVIGLIPPGASVLTTPHLFPQVSDRLNAFLLPLGQVSFAPGRTFGGFTQQYVNRSQYILVDFQVDPTDAQILLKYANFTGGLSAFGLKAAVAGAYLFERGWTEPPVMYVPFDQTIQVSDMIPEGPSTRTSSNISVYPGSIQTPPTAVGTQIWTGPLQLLSGYGLPPGNYTISFEYYVKATSPGSQVTVRVVQTPITYNATPNVVSPSGTHYLVTPYVVLGNRTTLASTVISVATATTGRWANESRVLTIQASPNSKIGFIAVTDSSSVTTRLYEIVITQTSALNLFPPTPTPGP